MATKAMTGAGVIYTGKSSLPPQELSAELICAEDLAELLGISVRQVWRWVSQRKIPTPIRLSKKVVRWQRAEIEKWIKNGCPDFAGMEKCRKRGW